MKNPKLKFEPNDFSFRATQASFTSHAADAAQMKFEEWLESQPVVYAVGSTDRIESVRKLLWSEETTGDDHYKARLVAMEFDGE